MHVSQINFQETLHEMVLKKTLHLAYSIEKQALNFELFIQVNSSMKSEKKIIYRERERRKGKEIDRQIYRVSEKGNAKLN